MYASEVCSWTSLLIFFFKFISVMTSSVHAAAPEQQGFFNLLKRLEEMLRMQYYAAEF